MGTKNEILNSIHELCVLEHNNLKVNNRNHDEAYINWHGSPQTFGDPISLQRVHFLRGNKRVAYIPQVNRPGDYFDPLRVQSAELHADDMTISIGIWHKNSEYDTAFGQLILDILQTTLKHDHKICIDGLMQHVSPPDAPVTTREPRAQQMLAWLVSRIY